MFQEIIGNKEEASLLTLTPDLYVYPSHTASSLLCLPLYLHQQPPKKRKEKKKSLTTWHTIKTQLFTKWQIAVEGDHIHPGLNVRLQLALSTSSDILL